MNPIVLCFADGTTFFMGLAFVVIAELLLLRFHSRIVRPILTVVVLVSATMVVISATPLPVWLYCPWGIATLGVLVLVNRSKSSRRIRAVSVTLLLITTACLFMAEVPYHLTPHLRIKGNATVYVLGDSISAGMRTNECCWPLVLGQITGLNVVNVARAGATAGDASAQVREITESNAVVIVEIGGNDLLGGTDSTTFQKQFDALISSLYLAHHQIAIMELPLFPFQNAFGRAQRNTAAKYKATLIPKRLLTKVLGDKGATCDGLHLSQAGHNAMAKSMAELIQKK